MIVSGEHQRDSVIYTHASIFIFFLQVDIKYFWHLSLKKKKKYPSFTEFTLSEVKLLIHVQIFATQWTVAFQAPPTMAFSRQDYWSGLPFPSPGESSWHRDWTRVSCITGRPDSLLSEPPGNPQSYSVWHLNYTLHMIFFSNLRFYIITRNNRITTLLHD